MITLDNGRIVECGAIASNQDWMRTLRRLTWAGLATLTVGACNCEEAVLTPVAGPGTCEQDFDCGQGLEYRRGECRIARCESDLDCCPGQRCSVVVGLCADQTIACTADADCTENPGQACIDFRGGRFCGYPNRGRQLSAAGTQGCASDSDCDSGRACVGQRCVVFAPCEGGCPNGQICDVDTNVCFEDPMCETTCETGEILIVENPDLMSGPQCCAVNCACAVLPPVQPGQLGWFTDLAADAERLVASAYDPVYRDLVVGRYASDGELLGIDYVDGFPSSGPIEGNPTGARGGRTGPGPDVGEHTSVTIDGMGAIHVAYYDREQGRLKYGYGFDGEWTTSVVDEGDNVGLYTSIAVGPDGAPRIAYMMAEGTVAPDPRPLSGLKVATARTNLPASPNDWDVQLVDQRPLPPPPCGGGCRGGELCADLGPDVSPLCLTVTATAACGGCGGDLTCVQIDDDNAACVEEFMDVPLDDLIPGVGLFASIAVTSTGTAVIAYYDRIVGDLKLAVSTSTGGFRRRTLDGIDAADPMGAGPDVGQHASVAIGPNDSIGIAYFDATEDDLVFYDLARDERTVVDDGVSPPDLRFVGADADLVFDAQGEPTIAYQDPTFIDLIYARRFAGVWSTEVVRGSTTAISSGFYATQAHRGSTAFVGGVDVDFDAEGVLQLRLVVTAKSL